MTEMIYNIIENAVKYNQQGEEVIIYQNKNGYLNAFIELIKAIPVKSA